MRGFGLTLARPLTHPIFVSVSAVSNRTEHLVAAFPLPETLLPVGWLRHPMNTQKESVSAGDERISAAAAWHGAVPVLLSAR